MTNVDLTPAELQDLNQRLVRLGFSSVDIFHRERLRIALDAPEGMALRFQHLAIELSNAEQAAFLTRFADMAEEMSVANPNSLRARIERLEFLHFSRRLLTRIGTP